MKKILSIFLILAMCMGLFISCDNEDVTSSSESQKQSKSVSESQGEVVSESQSQMASQFEQNPTEDNINMECYSFYNIKTENIHYFDYQTWMLKDYDHYLEFLNQNAISSISEIKSETFDDCFVLVVFHFGGYPYQPGCCGERIDRKYYDYDGTSLNYSYLIKNESGGCILESLPKTQPKSFDFVIIPNEKCEISNTKINLNVYCQIVER